MYTRVNDISEIDLEKYGSFRLCYIDDIEQEVYNPDYDPDDFRSYRMSPWIPNPEYVEGKKEKWAFFTPMFERQWGDDWNDAPYEHNAGYPYDDYRDETGNNVDYETEDIDLYAIKNFKTVYELGKAHLKHTKDELVLTDESGKVLFTQPMKSLYTLNTDFHWYQVADTICIGDEKMRYYCAFKENQNFVSKARMATEEAFKLTKKQGL